MSFINALFMGALQGVTEFLPVSSSGHLVLIAKGLNFKHPGVTFEVMMHMGTLISIVVCFWGDIRETFVNAFRRKEFDLVWSLVIATAPVAIVGYFFKANIESAFNSTSVVGICLLATGVILVSTRFVGKGTVIHIGLAAAFIVGLAQALALLPGISRSGITISTGLWLGFTNREAGRFSFLMAIPALIGSALLTLPEIIEMGNKDGSTFTLWVAFLSAFVVGLIALKTLLGILRSGKLYLFSGYCFLMGVVALTLRF